MQSGAETMVLQLGSTDRRSLMLPQAGAGPHGLDAWRWAWSCVHSRSFKDGAGGHLIVPGIDMANHSFAPTAAVRCAMTISSLPVLVETQELSSSECIQLSEFNCQRESAP